MTSESNPNTNSNSNINSNTTQSVTNCCICYLSDNGLDSNNQWTCSTCNTKCHMNCILQWALTNVVHRNSFTCPMCRHVFSLSSLVHTDTHHVETFFPRSMQSLMFLTDPAILSARRPIMSVVSSLLRESTRVEPTIRTFVNTNIRPNMEEDQTNTEDEPVNTETDSEQRNNSNSNSNTNSNTNDNHNNNSRSHTRRTSPSVLIVSGSGAVRINKLTVINR